jgi:phosphoribosylformimino-5-aminoimidazole carboxamide ribotide isomerase
VELFPAIDVQGGRVARALPEPGAGDPLARARAFAAAGARWVHFVDLDRAFGRGDNRELARRFLAAAAIPVQVGGGLRTDAAVDELLGWGARRVVVGAPTPDAGLVERLLGRYGTERIAVGIDGRDGRVAPRGGSEILDFSPLDLARRVRDQGVRTVIYTDAARDGMLSGPDVEGARAIAALGLEVVLSGGVAALDDLRRARSAGLAGLIVGRALHEGRFTLAEALTCVA